MIFKIVKSKINIVSLSKSMQLNSAGAYVSFEGWIRDHNDDKKVKALHYESEESIANNEGLRIIQEASSKFSISSAKSQHRVGDLKIGDCAVWVGVTADHRADAFKACCYIIDELKERLPIWKKELYSDLSSSWINSDNSKK
ncbi:MAG: hypothetical protein CBC38_04355 [Gammaproteobacteria bacterium TMED78]|nr:MAG: hypothetical protein CBC38_04355 [Gammaproteobacteria bacterium TMED78]|tara:strand:- start:77621 stop:78046 length:426 start_codon:yes stop_codon:yes gene_type:complete